MKKIREIACTSVVIGVFAMGLSACQPKEGPMERAGKKVDNAVQSAGKEVEKAGEKIQDAAKDAKK
jgi:predicted small secreted protein